MRRQRVVWAAGGAALLLALAAGVLAGRAQAQSTRTPWLGVTTQEITSDLRDGIDYTGRGVLVNRVITDGPADRAGIRQGDVIVSFNSRAVDSPDQLVDLVRSARVGQSCTLTIVRDGARRSVTARLASRSEQSDEEFEAPEAPPAPEAPEAPEAPRAPKGPRARSYTFSWDGDSMELPDGIGDFMWQGMGRARLGVRIQDLNPDLADALGVPGGRGVLVTGVIDDTPASRVGIKAGDVITQVAGQSIDDTNDLHRALQDRDGRVRITLMRRGARRTVEPELEARTVTRVRRGDGATMLRIPDVRTRVMRDRLDSDERRDLEAQLRELRQQLNDLRQKMEAMEKN